MYGLGENSERHDFSEEILTDLIWEGYHGDELKEKLTERKVMITSAVENLIEEARSSKSYGSFEDMLKEANGKG